jgi:hypothetical protein
MGKKRNVDRVLEETCEGKRQFRRPKRKMNPQETEWNDVDWIHLAQDKYNGGLL